MSNGEYRQLELDSLINSISENPFQRVIDNSRVDTIINGLLEERNRFGYSHVIQTGVLQIAQLSNGSYYIIDGQHRLEAYKKLKEPKLILAQVWRYGNLDDMLKKFRDINSNLPIEEYVMKNAASINSSLSRIDPNSDKIKFDTLIKYLKDKYPTLTMERNNSRCIWPNINIDKLIKLTPYIPELKDSTTDNIILRFEQLNQKCKNNMVNGLKPDRERITKSVNDNLPPLYLNRYLNDMWNRYGSTLT